MTNHDTIPYLGSHLLLHNMQWDPPWSALHLGPFANYYSTHFKPMRLLVWRMGGLLVLVLVLVCISVPLGMTIWRLCQVCCGRLQ